MKKNTVFYAVIVILVAMIVTAGVKLVSGGGLIPEDTRSEIVSMSNTGSVTLLRRSAGYEIKDGVVLIPGDEIRTYVDSGCVLGVRDVYTVVLGERTVLDIATDDAYEVTYSSGYGCVIYETLGDASFSVKMGEAEIRPSGRCLFSVETYPKMKYFCPN